MQNIPGTDIYTTTTTPASGTPPTAYDLRINVTDNFSTGAGEDKWEFKSRLL